MQLDRLVAYCTARGWEEAEVYIDQASGADTRRPALMQMLQDAHRRHFDAILVVRLDRLMRSTLHLLAIVEQLDHDGVALVCLDQPIDTSTGMGRLLLTVLGAVAEFERDLIRERTMDGLARARAKGKRLGRPPKRGSKSHKKAI